MSIRRAVGGLLALMRKRRLDGELESEILAHLELAERDAVARGLSPEEARLAARRSFGGIEQVKEEHRDRRSFPWIETLLRDFRYGLSSLRRDPGFAVVAVGVLALGIGANTAMFSVVDAVLLKPVPYPEPERMVTVDEAPNATTRYGASALNFVDWKRLSAAFESLSAESPTSAATMMGGEPMRLAGELVSADYFKVLGVRAQLGRTFAPGEDQPGAARVVLLSHSAWQERFGGAADILNRDLLLDGEPHRIIGVLPAGSFDRDVAVFWKPLVFTPAQLTRESMWLRVVGRLRAGVSLEQAREDMRKVSAGLESVNPPWKKGWTAIVDPFGRQLVGNRLRRSIYVAFGAVLMVLLIACSNVANLLLARGAARTKEMAVRAALGASRGRLIGQLLTESLALCVLGGAAGVALAYLLLRAVLPLTSLSLPSTAEVGLNPSVLFFAGAIVLGVALLVGLLPSLRTSSGALSASLNQATRGSSDSRAMLRRAIVVGEVAVSLVLICGASLMFRSLLNLQNGDAGVRTENVIATSVVLPLPAYPTAESAARFVQAAVERLQAVPGVERAAGASDLPFEGVHETDVIIANW
ncbi:MAG: ABC transporter permease, partial [Bryobacteraceae bacterium]